MTTRKKSIILMMTMLVTVSVYSTPVKSSLATSGVEYSQTTPAPSYTAADYIQDGLIIMWDGIENAGWGIHDSEATVWKNLMGDSGYDFPNCASWGDSYFDLSSAYVDVLNSTDPKTRIRTASSFSKNDFGSCDFVFSAYQLHTSSSTYEIFSTVADGNNRTIIGVITPPIWKDTRWGLTVCAYNYSVYFNPALGRIEDCSRTHSIHFGPPKTSGTYYPIYLNAEEITVMPYNNQNLYASPFQIGTKANKNTTSINKNVCGRFYCIRIYNRQLSAEEVEWNFMVDKVRFKMPK